MPLSHEPPQKPSTRAHIVDTLTFRSMGVLLLANEVVPDHPADWHVLVAGFAMFFMPDALRGRSSVVWRLLERVTPGDESNDR